MSKPVSQIKSDIAAMARWKAKADRYDESLLHMRVMLAYLEYFMASLDEIRPMDQEPHPMNVLIRAEAVTLVKGFKEWLTKG